MENITTAKAVIASHGGAAAVARRLGYRKFGVQRVSNWTHRGIPSRVLLQNAWLRKAKA